MDEEEVQRVREAIKLRISNLDIQVGLERLTPYLQEEIHHAIKVHENALKLLPDLNVSLVNDLDRLQDNIEKHWSRVYKSCIDHGNLMCDMGQFQIFLTELLLSEYAGASLTDTGSIGWLHQSATHIQKAATDTSNEFRAIFDESIVLPLQELLLNRPFVQTRLLLAAADDDQQRPLGGHIQNLIKRGDWQDLARYLYYDRALSITLFKYQPLVPGLFGLGIPEKVLQGITSIQDKYFTDLSSSTEYTISKYAMDLETMKQTPGSPSQTTAMLSAVEHRKPLRDSLSPRNHAKSIFNAIAGGIKSLATHSGSKQAAGKQVSVNATPDEKTPLVNEKES